MTIEFRLSILGLWDYDATKKFETSPHQLDEEKKNVTKTIHLKNHVKEKGTEQIYQQDPNGWNEG